MSKSELEQTYWESVESHQHRRSPTHPVVAAFARPKLDLVAQYGALDKGATVLDVGCGNGFFTYHLPPRVHAVGLDLSSVMLRLNPCPHSVQGSALSLPFPDHAFDTVLCSNLLHHLPSPQTAVREMKRVARRHIVLSEPNRNNPAMLLLGLAKREERGTLQFTPRYLRHLAQSAGLNVSICQALGMITPNRIPPAALSLLHWMDGSHPLGAYILLVAEKD